MVFQLTERHWLMRSRILRVSLVLFALYFVAVYPTEAAQMTRDAVSGAIDIADSVAQSLSDFLRGLV